MVSIGICIPTYQRGKITKDSIIKIYNRNKPLFERGVCHFYISDDCSKDGTFELLSSLALEIGCITISKTPSNLGFEGNIEKCIQMCEKDYAWLLGDDDTINVGIDEIINKIDESSPDFIIIGKRKDVEEKVFEDKVETIKTLIYESTWMSGLIYKNVIVKELNFSRYSEGEFPQTGAIFDYFGLHDSTIQYIYGENYASILRPGIISYNDKIIKIYAKGWTNLVMGLPLCYDYKLKLCILQERGKRGKDVLSNLGLMSLRAQKQFSHTVLQENYEYIKLYNKTPYFLLCLISVLPVKLMAILRENYAKLMGIQLTQKG